MSKQDVAVLDTIGKAIIDYVADRRHTPYSYPNFVKVPVYLKQPVLDALDRILAFPAASGARFYGGAEIEFYDGHVICAERRETS